MENAFFMRLLVAVSFFITLVLLSLTAGYGKRIRQIRHNRLSEKGVDEEKIIKIHRSLARWVATATFMSVLVTEAYAMNIGRSSHNWFFWLHISVAVGYVILLTLLLTKYSGLKAKQGRHKKIAYVCMAFYVATLATGLPRLFPELLGNYFSWLLE